MKFSCLGFILVFLVGYGGSKLRNMAGESGEF